MSRSALAPIPIGTTPINLQVGGQLQLLNGIKCGNESDSTLYWQWGDQSGYLYPSEIDVLRPDAQSKQQVVFTPTAVLQSPMALTKNLLVEFAYGPDDFPGAWPQQMSRLSQAVEQVFLGNVIAPGGGTNSKSFPLPSGTVSIGWAFNFGVASLVPSNVTITGDQTGNTYYNNSPSTLLPVHPSLRSISDTSVTLSVTSPSVGNPSTADLLAWTTSLNQTITQGDANNSPFLVAHARLVGSKYTFIADPAPWQSFPNSTHLDVTSSGADILVQNPIGIGSPNLVHGNVSWFSSASARLALKDGTGGTTFCTLVFQAGGTPAQFPFKGHALGIGNGFVVNTGNGNEVEFTLNWANQFTG